MSLNEKVAQKTEARAIVGEAEEDAAAEAEEDDSLVVTITACDNCVYGEMLKRLAKRNMEYGEFLADRGLKSDFDEKYGPGHDPIGRMECPYIR